MSIQTSVFAAPQSFEGWTYHPAENGVPSYRSFGGYAPAIPRNPNIRSDGPVYHWESGYNIFGGYSNSESWNADETALYPIDYIYVKCRLYEDNALYRSAEDEQENAAVARVNVSGSGSLLAKREVYGNHEFRHAGYEDMIEESHAE